ncbi:MAG: carboxypeptidase-like regulatory domain-containing protein [Chloroflexota bacterium]
MHINQIKSIIHTCSLYTCLFVIAIGTATLLTLPANAQTPLPTRPDNLVTQTPYSEQPRSCITVDDSMQIGATISGTVVDSDGEPVASSLVRIVDSCWARYTDDQGHFEIPNIFWEGEVHLVAESPWAEVQNHYDSLPITVTVTQADVDTLTTITLAQPLRLRGPQINGILLFADDTPATGARAYMKPLRTGESTCPDAEAGRNIVKHDVDDTGAFWLGGMEMGQYCLFVEPPGYYGTAIAPAPILLTISTALNAGNEPALDVGVLRFGQPSKTIHGTVRDQTTGAGVANMMVVANPVDEYIENRRIYVETETDENGDYTLHVYGDTWLINIYSQEEGLGLDRPQRPFRQQIQFAGDDTTETQTLDFDIRFPSALLTGRIVSPDGSPLTMETDAIEYTFPGYPDSGITIGLAGKSGYNYAIRIEPSGFFTMPVYADTYLFHLRISPGFVRPPIFVPFPFLYEITLSDGEIRNLGDILLQEPQVTGRVITQDRTVYTSPFLRVYRATIDDEEATGCQWHYSFGMFENMSVEEGVFTIGSLSVGDYCLQVAPAGITGYRPYTDNQDNLLYPPAPISFTVTDTDTVVHLGDIALLSSTKIVHGMIQTANGERIRGTQIEAIYQPSFLPSPLVLSTTTDEDGLFTFNLIGGLWDLRIEQPSPWFTDNDLQRIEFANDSTAETENIVFTVPERPYRVFLPILTRQ